MTHDHIKMLDSVPVDRRVIGSPEGAIKSSACDGSKGYNKSTFSGFIIDRFPIIQNHIVIVR